MDFYTEKEQQVKARQEVLYREAEQARLAAEAGVPQRLPFYGPALAQVGNVLVNVGNQLQKRYGEMNEAVPHMAMEAKPKTAS